MTTHWPRFLRRRTICRRKCRGVDGHTFRRGCLLRAPWDH